MDFFNYLLAVIDHAFFWFGGVALVLIEVLKKVERTRRWAENIRREFWAVAVVCIFIATFQAWLEQRRLTLYRATYMELRNEGAPAVPMPLFVSNRKSQIDYYVENGGGFLAENFFGMGGLVIRDIDHRWDMNTDKLLPSTPAIEESVFNQFLKENAEKLREPRSRLTVDPHTRSFQAAYSNYPLTDQQATGLRYGDKIMYLLVIMEWTDGAGTHEKRYCQIVHPPADTAITTDTCIGFNDFLAVAKD